MEYLIQKSIKEVNPEELLKPKEALATLKELAEVEVQLFYDVKLGKKDKLDHFQFILPDGNVITKKNTGTALINTLCSLANVNLIRVSKEGVQESKLIGYLIEPIKSNGVAEED